MQSIDVLKEELKHIEPKSLFKMLYKYSKPIKKWVIQNSGNANDAEDVLQDAMIAFYQLLHKPNFIFTSKPETLLFGIARKIWLYQLRQNKRMHLQSMIDNIDFTDEDSHTIEEELKYNEMEKALALLGEKCKKLLDLFYFEKKDMVEIAQILDFRNDKVAKAMKYKCLEKAKVLINTK